MDNRRPDKVTMVKSFEQDSARRDITINSMGLTTNGELIDYHGGLKDLEAGLIRSVGKSQERFTEDALRILRAARFASKFGFKIDPETRQGMIDIGHLVDKLSKERIQEELLKISGNGEQLATYIEYLDDVGLLERILPEVKALQGKKQNPAHHPEGDAYNHTLSALRHSRSDNPTTNLSVLFHDLGKGTVDIGDKGGQPTYHGHDKESAKIAEEIGKRLKFPNVTIDGMVFAARNHMKMHNIDKMTKKKISKLVNDKNWEILKDVAYADKLSRGDIGKGGIDEFDAKISNAEIIASEISGGMGAEGERLRIKEKIDGDKVMRWTGLRQGKELGRVLDETQNWLYDNLDATEEEVKDFVLNTYKKIKEDQPTLEESYDYILRSYHENETVQRTTKRYLC